MALLQFMSRLISAVHSAVFGISKGLSYKTRKVVFHLQWINDCTANNNNNNNAPRQLQRSMALAIFRQAYATALITVYIDNDDGGRVMNWDAFQPIKVLPYNASACSADTRGMHFGTVDSCAAYVYRLIEAARRDDLDWLILAMGGMVASCCAHRSCAACR